MSKEKIPVAALAIRDRALFDQVVRSFAHAGWMLIASQTVKDLGSLMEETTPSVVVTDMLSEAPGGENMIRAIREQKSWKKLPIIAVGHFFERGIGDVYRRRARKAGANFCVHDLTSATELTAFAVVQAAVNLID